MEAAINQAQQTSQLDVSVYIVISQDLCAPRPGVRAAAKSLQTNAATVFFQDIRPDEFFAIITFEKSEYN